MWSSALRGSETPSSIEQFFCGLCNHNIGAKESEIGAKSYRSKHREQPSTVTMAPNVGQGITGEQTIHFPLNNYFVGSAIIISVQKSGNWRWRIGTRLSNMLCGSRAAGCSQLARQSKTQNDGQYISLTRIADSLGWLTWHTRPHRQFLTYCSFSRRSMFNGCSLC